MKTKILPTTLRRTLLPVLLLMLAATAARAARAFGEAFTLAQPDGTQLTVRLYGDEHQHWTALADGTLVVPTARGCFVARIADDGSLEATPLLAHAAGRRTAAEEALVGEQRARHSLFAAAGEQALHRAQVSATGRYVPHTGSPRILVVLAAYQDQAFTVADPKLTFEQYFNGTTQQDLGNGEDANLLSVKKYFELSSSGQFSPQFDVVGPVVLPEAMAYYGANTGASGSDQRMSQLARDACQLVKDEVDFSVYDNDGDGVGELMFVLHAGYGENIGGVTADAMWAKVSSVGATTESGFSFARIGCSAELFHPQYKDGKQVNGIGVFCHEFSHALGLPDLYVTTSAGRTVNNQTMEYWSLMDGGIYTAYGYAPTPYTAWEREVMGWADMVLLTGPAEVRDLKPVYDGGKAYKFGNGANKEEFIVLENVQWQGMDGQPYGGHGLLAYHVAYSRSTVNMGDSPNNTAGKPSVAVVPADGLMISTYLVGNGHTAADYYASFKGDPFPGSQQVTELSDDMQLPNYHFYQKTGEEEGSHVTGFFLKNISEDETTRTVSFDFGSGDSNGIVSLTGSGPRTTGYYTLDGRYADSEKNRLTRGVYVKDCRKVVVGR